MIGGMKFMQDGIHLRQKPTHIGSWLHNAQKDISGYLCCDPGKLFFVQDCF